MFAIVYAHKIRTESIAKKNNSKKVRHSIKREEKSIDMKSTTIMRLCVCAYKHAFSLRFGMYLNFMNEHFQFLSHKERKKRAITAVFSVEKVCSTN